MSEVLGYEAFWSSLLCFSVGVVFFFCLFVFVVVVYLTFVFSSSVLLGILRLFLPRFCLRPRTSGSYVKGNLERGCVFVHSFICFFFFFPQNLRPGGL
jgi:hypothetical protein